MEKNNGYFNKYLEERFKSLEDRIDKLEKKMDDFQKWLIATLTTSALALLSLALNLIFKK
jgi:hypothetical protein